MRSIAEEAQHWTPTESPVRATLFEEACNHAAIGLCLVDPSGTFLRVNPAACRILERRESEIVGLNFAALTHPDDLSKSRANQHRLHDGEVETATFEKRYLRPDGTAVWALVNISTVRDSDTGSPHFFIAQIQDITAQKESDRELREAREQFRLLAETSTDLIARLAPDATLLYVSPACQSVLGLEPAEVVGRSSYDFVHPDEVMELRRVHNALLEGAPALTTTHRLRRHDGIWAWVESSSRIVRLDETPERIEIHVSSRDVTERRRSEERIRELARRLEEANRHLKQANVSLKEIASTDALTGLGNRRAFDRRLNLELRRASRNGAPVALLYLDLDRFKDYNDRFGHPAGDEVLIKLAGILSRSIRTSDTAARIGGEEFVVILPQTDEAGATALGEKLRRAVARRLAARRPLTISIGAATLHLPVDGSPDLEAAAAALVHTADGALYRSKREGRDRVRHQEAMVAPRAIPGPRRAPI